MARLQMISQPFAAGQRVAVTQQIGYRDDTWSIRVEGTVLGFEQKKTGSWFAHAKDDRLWLDRLKIRKDDGEIIVCNLDRYTHVAVLAEPAPPQNAGAPATEAAGGEALS